jgi:dihydrofolate synthase/folylpolyglutamate synthase
VRYPEAVAALEGALRFGINPSLDGIRALTDALGRPQDAYSVVQVTGTNGKSSVTRLVEAILVAEGMSAGGYMSPHLESYTERIEVGGAPVGEGEFAGAIEAALDAAAGCGGVDAFTEFELLTAAALWLFRERAVDFACLEVGMGGRWDSTSVAEPAVAVVTGVGLDHTERLGATVEEIAEDKSHIIKPGSSVVLGPGTAATLPIFVRRTEQMGSHARFVARGTARSPVADELTVRFDVLQRPRTPGGSTGLDVHGVHGNYRGLAVSAPSYQAANVATAIAAAECALGRGLRGDRLAEALEAMTFPGRFELVVASPPIVLDGAHNPQAAYSLATAVMEAWPDAHSRPECVLGVLTDKDAAGIVAALSPAVARFVVTQPAVARALPASELATLVRDTTGTVPETLPVLADAIERARELGGPRGILITGSLYTVGEARTLLRQG